MRLATALIIGLTMNVGCAPEISNRDSQKGTNLRIIWRKPISQEPRIGSLSMNPILFDRYVIINSEYDYDGHSSPVLFLDTATGEVLDYWSDYSSGPYIYMNRAAVQDGQYLFLGGQRSVDCINLRTKTTQWQSSVEPNSPYLYTHDGYLYRGIEFDGENPHNNSAALIRTPVSHRDWEYVYSFTKTDNRTPSFTGITGATTNSGDQVVLWKNRGYVPSNGQLNRTDIFAYNLTQDSLMWRNMDFQEGSGIAPMKVEDDIVYGTTHYSLFAIDLKSGETLWQTSLEDQPTHTPFSLAHSDFHLNESTIILKGSSREVFGIDKVTGEIEWIIEGNSGGVGNWFTNFDGKLFFGDEVLEIADAQTGYSLLDPRRAREIDLIISCVTVDPHRRVLYVVTYDEILCVKIPDDL